MKHRAILFPVLLSAFFLGNGARAEGQTQLTTEQQAETLFWNQLYSAGGLTLYCNTAFKTKTATIGIDHPYALDQIADHLRCPSLRSCEKNAEFQRMAADLHNQYPAEKKIIRDRRKSLFGTVPGNQFKFEDCQYKTSFQDVEPRNTAKGDIARAILYMHVEYGLPIPGRQDLMRQWNDIDPVDANERKRNDLIEKLQGNRNRFIDHPEQVEDLYKF